MTTVDEVTGGLLPDALAAGLVRVRRHPTRPLVIYNYTERAVFEREWNAATRSCRGLIADEAGTVLARPWRKDEPVVVSDKTDGSLGVAADPGRGLVFAALDGRPITARSWAAVRPEHERPLLQRGEDVA